MARPRDPEITRRVEAVQAAIAADPNLSLTRACADAGVSYQVYRYRTNGAPAPKGDRDELTQEVDPGEVQVVYRDYSHLDHLNVYPLGDVHKGSPNHLGDAWREWLDYLEGTPNCSMLGTGDFFNAALKDSVSDAYEEELTVREARKVLTSELGPLAAAEKIDCLSDGNHEARIVRATGDSPVDVVCDVLGVPYVPAAAMVVYKVGEVEYEVYFRHGTGSGRPGAQANRLERQSLVMAADVYLSGHTHQQQVLRGAIFVREGLQVVRRRQVYVSSGSFLSYEDYAAAAGLPPADVGAPRIRLDGTRKDVHVSV